MDFSACVISKGLGPAPVKLGDSSFSAGLQIKQSCLAKQNPLQSYFPPSVWPDKIQGNHFNPEAFPDQETLDQSDWRKGPINTLSRPFLKLSASSVGVSEKIQLTLRLSQQESGFTSAAHPTLSEQPSWTENICFLTSVFYSFPPFESDTFPQYWQLPEFPHWFKSFQVTCQIFSFTLVLCSPVSNASQSLPAALCRPVVSLDVCNRDVSPQCGCSGRVLRASWRDSSLTILFQRGQKRTTKHPSPAAWTETQHQLGSVRPVSTGKPRITASIAAPSSVTPLSSLAASPPLWGKAPPRQKSEHFKVFL